MCKIFFPLSKDTAELGNSLSFRNSFLGNFVSSNVKRYFFRSLLKSAFTFTTCSLVTFASLSKENLVKEYFPVSYL